MKKFLIVYFAPVGANKRTAGATPEQRQAGMKAWMDWAAKCGDKLVDLGSPVAPAVTVTASGTKSPSAGMETGGYSILRANDMEGAKELLNGHPHLMWSPACAIDIMELIPLPTE